MKVLITGTSGMLGSAVLKDLGANDLSGTLINASTGSCGEG